MTDATARWTLGTLWLLVFTSGSQTMVVTPVLPRIAEQLGTDPALLGTLVAAYAVTTGLVAFAAGPVSDAVGRRRVLVWGAAGMAGALALHGLAASFPALLAVRALAGAAGGLLSGAAVAYVGDALPVERRGWAAGWVMSGMAAGQILGIPVGAVLAGRLGYRAPFLAFAVLMAATAVLVALRLPQPDVERAETLSLGSALASYRDLLTRTDVRAAAVVFVLMFGGTALFTTYLPTFLEARTGMSPDAVAGLFLVGGLASVAAGPLSGRLSDRVGRRRVIVGASLGVAVAMAAFPFVAASAVAAYALFFVAMAGFSGRAAPFQALLTELAPARQRGTLLALVVAAGQLGVAGGSTVAGPVYSSLGYAASALLAAASVLAVIALLVRYVPDPGGGPEGAAPSGVEALVHHAPPLAPTLLAFPKERAAKGKPGALR